MMTSNKLLTKWEVKKYCIRCREKTIHCIRGFVYYNRRLQCNNCHSEIWSNKNEYL
jgi:ribosomal protein L33